MGSQPLVRLMFPTFRKYGLLQRVPKTGLRSPLHVPAARLFLHLNYATSRGMFWRKPITIRALRKLSSQISLYPIQAATPLPSVDTRALQEKPQGNII